MPVMTLFSGKSLLESRQIRCNPSFNFFIYFKCKGSRFLRSTA